MGVLSSDSRTYNFAVTSIDHVSRVKWQEEPIFSCRFLVLKASYIKRERTNFKMCFELSFDDVFSNFQKIGTCYYHIRGKIR